MKKFIYILLVLLIASCANRPSMNKEISIEEALFEAANSEDNENTILKEKLTRYFDLLKLKVNHPDFETDLVSQLQKLSQNKIIEIKNLEASSLENIKVSDSILVLSDSTEKIKITYDIINKDSVIKDSIYAYKTTTEITVDGYSMKSFEIKFDKE
ncbi:hypothetical protein EV195_107221 [Tenacibaculum skagerrakense]|uniref:Lipoprotein n=1 Tax=Tenacibaculum skagerrakense TaxID=186571 RepID=A0A4R2NRK2_9FLAO|nr:hypothetical protein [Tenacibaculum skagerrakense]TCP24054.1 hypothetical protein EV195_107221 [Tenacibaculum skagerrakense]